VRDSEALLADLLVALPELRQYHAPSSATYRVLRHAARNAVEDLFGPHGLQKALVGPFGVLDFPYHSMGSINSLDLFGIDEFIILAFYFANRARYRRVLDLGANIGLHTFAMSRCGFEVIAYEPDPRHIAYLNRTIAANNLTNVTPVNAAISITSGQQEFIRVVDNTTGSHLAGAKSNPYGALERFEVRVEPFKPLLASADLAKIDIEGHEATVLATTDHADWESTDAIVEIGSPANAEAVFKHFAAIGIGLFAQKIGWSRVTAMDQMPTSHRDGSLFISVDPKGPWNMS
jgi:FkbM family methyltransferase